MKNLTNWLNANKISRNAKKLNNYFLNTKNKKLECPIKINNTLREKIVLFNLVQKII